MPLASSHLSVSWRSISLVAVGLAALAVQAGPLQQSSLRNPLLIQSFEEHGAGEKCYVWRDAGTVVVLKSGGRVEIATPGGKTASFTFAGAGQSVQPEGERLTLLRTFSYRGTAAASHAHFERVRYHRIYPGIDLLFISKQGQLEFDLEVSPGANLDQVRIQYDGVKLRDLPGGAIGIEGPAFRVTQERPLAFQSGSVGKQEIACRYQRAGTNEVRLRLGKYDSNAPLLVDPVLNFSTFLGGSSFDAAYAVVADSTGNLYVAGETSSEAITGGFSSPRNSRDAFVAKLNSAGTGLLWVTYFGGSQYDSARGIAIDSMGALYVTGMTDSTDFPATSGALSTQNSGGYDAFVVKLSASGAVVYSTYFGGGGNDEGNGVAVDSSGSAYIAGQTTSSSSLPLSASALQRTYGGGLSDCFVAKLNPAGNALAYSTFLGGNGTDLCRGIAIDSSGNAYVAGSTYSSNFPAAIVLGPGGGGDAFASKINSSGSALWYSTVFGGTSVDDANAIAVDSTGAAYIAGDTSSKDFPATTGAFQSALKGIYNAFAVKLTSAGSALTYATLFGGSSSDTANAIVVDQQGRAVLAGYTQSTDLPTLDPIQAVNHGGFDAFVAVLGANGANLSFASYFGGSGDDRAFAVAALPGNQIYAAGYTASSDFPIAGAASEKIYDGAYDAFALEVTYGGGLRFVALTPCRIVDTRNAAYGALFGPPYMAAGSTRTFPLPASPCNIPGTASAFSLNITAVPRTGSLQFLTVWPAGAPFPIASTLNAFDGRIVANAALLGAGVDGGIEIFVSNDTDVLVDINGYFDSPANPLGLGFYPKTPCRIADTRTTQSFTGAFGPPAFAANGVKVFPILSSSCHVPSAAEAYSLNVTALPVAGQPLGYLSVWPAGEPFPVVSTLNSSNGSVVANAALVPAGMAGGIQILASNPTDLIVDYDGYFAPPATGSLSFYPVTPCRVVDTRASQSFPAPFGQPSLATNTSRNFPVFSSPCGIPSTAQAYALNVTALPPGPLGFVTVWPAGQPFPVASTLNSPTGTVVANAAIIPAGTGGAVTVYTSNPTDIILDIVGYFAP